jgi:hypothetical protein
MKLSAFISQVKHLVPAINKAAKIPFVSESALVLDELKKRSPVDSGMYRESWKSRTQLGGGSLYSVVFYNDDPKFALMEFGAEPQQAPWYYPHRNKKTGQFKKGTGKLTLRKERVWAGGLKPGHALTVGGAITPTIEKFQKARIGEKISEVIMRRI